MRAAVVRSFEQAPVFGELAEPTPRGDEVIVKVRAAAASQLARAIAAGKHYSSRAEFPFVAGFDGVGALADGRRVYFAGVDRPYGAIAERVAISPSRLAAVPDDVDDVLAAALANPAMSSWAALTARAKVVAGERVWVVGATGASGKLAVQIAKHLGAARVVALGRSAKAIEPLPALGADAVVALEQPASDLRAALVGERDAHGVDVVLDYLWGPPAEAVLAALVDGSHGQAAPRVRYVQLGSLAGANIALPGGALRSSGLELMGSGLGALSLEALVASCGQCLSAARAAKLAIAHVTAPLEDIASAWAAPTAKRLVITI